SVSSALGKLRTFFTDPLFVRSGNTMQPTPRAVEIMGAVREVLSRIGTDIVAAPSFEPGRSHRPIVLALSDVGEVVFLPSILRQLRLEAPGVSLRSVSLPAEDVASGLESGTIDLALGYFPNLKRHNFFQQTLFSDSFTCLIRADHPVKSARLTQKQFRQLDHAVVRAESRTEEVIERFLARHRIQRRVTLTTPHFASVPPIVEQSDLVVTVPVPLARYFSTVSAGIRIIRPPFEAPSIELKQIWHRKFHHDARSRWLRTLMCGLFQKPAIES
ncbi:MAG TPA: LysR substrate-binding domain-containing protein, partial [Steroidobacteraceae bacterium]